MLERPHPLVEIRIEVVLLLAQLPVAVLQVIDLALQIAHLGLQRIDLARELHQALIGHDPLDLRDARIEIVHPDLHRILIRRNRGAAGGEHRDERERDDRAHGELLWELVPGKLTAAAAAAGCPFGAR